MIEAHTARSLNYRFEDQGCKFVLMSADDLCEGFDVGRIPLAVKRHFRRRGEVADGQGGAECSVHTGDGVADTHCVPRVAVVAAADGDEVGLVVIAGTRD